MVLQQQILLEFAMDVVHAKETIFAVVTMVTMVNSATYMTAFQLHLTKLVLFAVAKEHALDQISVFVSLITRVMTAAFQCAMAYWPMLQTFATIATVLVWHQTHAHVTLII